MRTIILVWTTKFNNLIVDDHNNFFGLGDGLRGTLSMFQLSKKYNFNLIVDTHLHPIEKYLKYNNNEYSKLIDDNKDNIPFIYPDQVESFVRSDQGEVNFFFTNSHLIREVTQEDRSFMQNILLPTDDFADYIQNIFIQKNISNFYNILHFRLGDSLLIRNDTNLNFDNYVNILNMNKENNDIFMSDSIHFKEHIKNINSSIILFNINIAHLGYENNSDKIKDTLLEFFIITKSQYIKTFTVYGHISGFVNLVHLIYDIPLKRIN